MSDDETWFQINFILKPVIQPSGASKPLGGSCNDLPQGLPFASLSVIHGLQEKLLMFLQVPQQVSLGSLVCL